MISSRQEAERWLREECAEAREGLVRFIEMHEAAQSARAFEPGEGDSLRLLKAQVHLKAIVGWSIDHEYVLHLLAPDVRAAAEQLEIIVANRAYAGDEGNRAMYRGLVAKQRRLLTNLAHPTGTMLNFEGHNGGLGKTDAIAIFVELVQILRLLWVDYGFALHEVAGTALGESQQAEIVALVYGGALEFDAKDGIERLAAALGYSASYASSPPRG